MLLFTVVRSMRMIRFLPLVTKRVDPKTRAMQKRVRNRRPCLVIVIIDLLLIGYGQSLWEIFFSKHDSYVFRPKNINPNIFLRF